MYTRLTLLIGVCTLLAVPAAAGADCTERIEELRARQAKAPLLDPQRPDLERLRRVAQGLAERGKEELCLELVEELNTLVKEHREHAREVKELENFADPVSPEKHPESLDSSRLVGMPVRNRLGNELGVVEGLRIAASQGRIRAIKVEHGGFLGIGERTVEIPWSELQLARDGSAVVVDMTEEEFGDRPEAE